MGSRITSKYLKARCAMSETHMNITVGFLLLSAELTGAVKKNDNGVEFSVMPQIFEFSRLDTYRNLN